MGKFSPIFVCLGLLGFDRQDKKILIQILFPCQLLLFKKEIYFFDMVHLLVILEMCWNIWNITNGRIIYQKTLL